MRTTLRAAALAASAAMVVVGVQAGSTAGAADRVTGATALDLSTAQRADALRTAQDAAPAAAHELGLGAKEQLVVRDVIKDADGTVHTRYERTYDGMPVLGGDLVVHTAKTGAVKGVDKATDAKISVATTASLKAAPTGSRKVVWAASGKPVLAYERTVTGTQPDGTPSRRDIVTDATTGAQLYSHEEIETRHRHQRVLRQGHPRHHQERFDLQPQRRRARRTQDVRPQGRQLRHGHAVHQVHRHVGQRLAVQPRDGRRRRRTTAPPRRGTSTRPSFEPQRHRGQRQGRLLPGPLRQRVRQRVLGRQLLLHDVRRRRGQQDSRSPRSTWPATR